MKCQAQTPDKKPCTNTASATAMVDGRLLRVCAFHHAVVSASIRQRRPVLRPKKDYSQPRRDLGAWKSNDELLGLTIKPKRGRR